MLILNNISKKFGDTFTLLPISLELQPGSILGFIGHNGAGKSTTLNIISGLIKPDTGDALIDEISITSKRIEALTKLGIVHESGEIYNSLTPDEFLRISSEFYDISKNESLEKIKFYTEFFGLEKYIKSAIGELSKGTKQKLLLISALIHDPSALVLDEPFNGFDIDSIIKAQELLKHYAKNGGIVIFSSHILSQIEKICTHLSFIKNGNITAYGQISDFSKAFPGYSMEEIYLYYQKNNG